MKYKAPKGVFDILPNEPLVEERWKESHRWQYIESIIRQCATDFCFKEMRTPIFEQTELFIRGVGDSSDIVSKEMYTFLDKADRSMTLRPEGTASIMRAFVEHRLDQMPGLHKYFYIGPMFRYERPQSGRYRQHHQFGAEAIGISQPEQDVEMILFLCETYRRLGLKNLIVTINSVGDESSRTAYKEALRAFLKPNLNNLSEDSQVRFEKNILRILDSKDTQDQLILKEAPTILNFLSPEATRHFQSVQDLLQVLEIPFMINPKLVRGLDYYTKTVFEVLSGELGAQNTIGAGGRYDGLTQTLGGAALPGVGFATGLERVLQTMMGQNASFPLPPAPFVFMVPIGAVALQQAFLLTAQLRCLQIPVEIDYSAKKVQHGIQLANAEKAVYCVVFGQREIESGRVELKHLAEHKNEEIHINALIAVLKERYQKALEIIPSPR